MQAILQVVEVILMAMEHFEHHYYSMVAPKDLEDLLGMMNIVLDSFLGVHLEVEQQCWAVLLDWVGSHLVGHPVDHLEDLLEAHQVDQEDHGHEYLEDSQDSY